MQHGGMLKGIGVGMSIGAVAATLMAKAAAENRTTLQRSAHKAAQAVTNLAGDVGTAVKDTVTHAMG